jgi:hypothetical protein
VVTGKVTDACCPRHRNQEFLRFFKKVAKAYPDRNGTSCDKLRNPLTYTAGCRMHAPAMMGAMVEVAGPGKPGVVRPSADAWGIGLYSVDNAYRFWFRTVVNLARRGRDEPDAVQVGGLPLVGPDTLVWVGFNPSRSDDNGRNRSALMNVLFWAARDGFADVVGVNLYAYRHTDIREVRRGLTSDRRDKFVGSGNEAVLRHVAGRGGRTLAAWGCGGHFNGRGDAVAAMLGESWCLGRCANGQPWHPARKSRDLLMVRYRYGRGTSHRVYLQSQQ